MLESYPPGPQNVLSMEIRSFQRIQGKVRSVGWAPIQYDGTHIKKGKFGQGDWCTGETMGGYSEKVVRWLE